MQKSDHLIIVGNGITGTTCAREVRKRSDCRITVISDETDFFFSRPALMYVFMRHMQPAEVKPYEDWFWKKNRIELLRASVSGINPGAKRITLASGETLSYTKLVLATGSQYNKFGWPGQDLQGVQGFYSWQDLELMEKNAASTNHAVIVGGGLIGVEVAEMLIKRGIAVEFLVRENHFWGNILPDEEATLVENHLRAHGVKLHMGTEMKSIEADNGGRARQVTLTDGRSLPAELVALTVGVSPNTALAKAAKIKINRGILVNGKFATSADGIFAAGDCAEFSEAPQGRRSVEQVWYTGKAQAEVLAQILTGDKSQKYAPGIWFNSAKFFELEYQIYGNVSPQTPSGEQTFYWQDATGAKCVRLAWRASDQSLTGIHAIGIRLRQDVCTGWIEKKRKIGDVMRELRKANFDPEFFKAYEKEIQAAFANKVAS